MALRLDVFLPDRAAVLFSIRYASAVQMLDRTITILYNVPGIVIKNA